MRDFVNDLTKKAAHAYVMNSLWSHMRIILLAWSPQKIRNKLNYVVVDGCCTLCANMPLLQ
jgi:hypothetical protein